MKLPLRYQTLTGLLLFGTSAHAQVKPLLATAPAGPPPLAFSSFSMAHDTLLARVTRVRAQADARTGYFTASLGALGGLHRRIKSYATAPGKSTSADGTVVSGHLIKVQVVKHRFGVEVEKLVYRDAKGRRVLMERYEDHQLMKQELREYGETFNAPVSSWLFVHGDYLRYSSSAISMAYKNGQRKSFFFQPRPAGSQ